MTTHTVLFKQKTKHFLKNLFHRDNRWININIVILFIVKVTVNRAEATSCIETLQDAFPIHVNVSVTFCLPVQAMRYMKIKRGKFLKSVLLWIFLPPKYHSFVKSMVLVAEYRFTQNTHPLGHFLIDDAKNVVMAYSRIGYKNL